MISSRTSQSAGTTYVKSVHVPKWQGVMQQFTESRLQKCKSTPLETESQRISKSFPTNSKYEGMWDKLGMNGYGKYTFPNGVEYEGDFHNGMMHGKGSLRYKTDDGVAVIRGIFNEGALIDRTVIFCDILEYQENYWRYCTMPDRRFAIEYKEDLKPAGKSFLTAAQPTKTIPPGYYDTGDGFFHPDMRVVYKYDDLTSIIRSPSIREQQWILDNCRNSDDIPLGPRPDLYENWSEPMLDLPPRPVPAAGVKTSSMTLSENQSL